MNALRSLVWLLIIGSGSVLAQTPGVGTITGTVRYLGKVPPSQRIMTTDGQVLIHNDIVVDKAKGLRDVAVILSWQEKSEAVKSKPIVIDQRDMVFVPRVVTVQEGQTVRFENNDTCNHCVHATSILPENAFSVVTPMNQPFAHKFKAQKQPIPISCPLHPWMRAWVFVTTHPYHSVTDAQGKFRIEQVPAGKQTLLFTHPDTGYRHQVSIEVHAGKATEVLVEWTKLKE